jgi:hypothetical protein
MVQTDDGRWSETAYAGSLILNEAPEDKNITFENPDNPDGVDHIAVTDTQMSSVEQSSLPSPTPTHRNRKDKG